jgi:hypothetical protein
MDTPAGADELRELVREVLRDALLRESPPALAGAATSARASSLAPPLPGSDPALAASPPTSVPVADPVRPAAPAAQQAAGGRDDSVQAVQLSTDEELHAFVLLILRLADNPKRRRDILGGRLRFSLAAGAAGPAPPAVIHRVAQGAVTERIVIAAAAAGAQLVLGPRAVLTPLARDKARALGVHVDKER